MSAIVSFKDLCMYICVKIYCFRSGTISINLKWPGIPKLCGVLISIRINSHNGKALLEQKYLAGCMPLLSLNHRCNI